MKKFNWWFQALAYATKQRLYGRKATVERQGNWLLTGTRWLVIPDTYVTCINCKYAVPFVEHAFMRYAMPCPRCGAPRQFGPGVYIDEFDGYTRDELLEKDYLTHLPH